MNQLNALSNRVEYYGLRLRMYATRSFDTALEIRKLGIFLWFE